MPEIMRPDDDLDGWRFALVVTRWSRSTKLRYAGPG